MPKRKYRNKSKGDVVEKTFIAYIVKGNRQIIRRDITASKRFRVDDKTYAVLDQCIYYKNIDGKLQSVSYYRENNPKPYDFKNENIGFNPDDFDDFFAEDLYHIINNITPENRSIYIFMMSIFNLIGCLLFMVTMILLRYVF